MEYKDYYKIMGVERSATSDELKKAHRKLARKFHPDVSQEKDAEARFKDLSEAYEVLRDPEKRAAYDQLGAHWKAGQDFRPPPDWNAGTEHAGPGFEWGFKTERPGQGADFSDFFESLFSRGFTTTPGRSTAAAGHGRAQRQTFTAKGEDHYAKILIDLEDVYSGAAKTLSLRLPQLDAQGHSVAQTHQISFDVPKGIRAGQHIRLAGQGSPGSGSGQQGDLYLEVAFRPRATGSPNYRVDKHDVYLDLPITPWEAALGAEVQAPTPSGTVEVTIPPASTSGRKLRLRGRGIPGSTPGDFYLVLQLVTPPVHTNSDKTVYTDMARQFTSFKPRGSWDQAR
jgi:curved DNA-binding protein